MQYAKNAAIAHPLRTARLLACTCTKRARLHADETGFEAAGVMEASLRVTISQERWLSDTRHDGDVTHILK